ncbi:hypothetical protein KWI06_09650, partial [Enterobacter cloacae]|uniref:HYD1 signature containing ADP-ribosyltransferase family protein n=2 Tax=Enterobacter cloacae TaxID=550 RepID=UPI0021D2012C
SVGGGTPKTLIHYTTEEGMKGITESGVIRPSSGDVHARFEDGQYFTNISPEMIGGSTHQRCWRNWKNVSRPISS